MRCLFCWLMIAHSCPDVRYVIIGAHAVSCLPVTSLGLLASSKSMFPKSSFLVHCLVLLEVFIIYKHVSSPHGSEIHLGTSRLQVYVCKSFTVLGTNFSCPLCDKCLSTKHVQQSLTFSYLYFSKKIKPMQISTKIRFRKIHMNDWKADWSRLHCSAKIGAPNSTWVGKAGCCWCFLSSEYLYDILDNICCHIC